MGKALISLNDHEPGWIIDSGASDHMTNDSKLFASYTTSPRNTIKVANGLSTPVLEAGSIPLSSSLSLSS